MQNGDKVVIRDMKPGEEKILLAAARGAFARFSLEQVAISTPKTAVVAEVNGAIAGAMFLKVYGKGENKTGYLDVGFVVKQYRGRGVGRVLYPAATESLYRMGCSHVTAMVLDDNAASWKTLENQGFGTPSLTGLLRTLGPGRAVSLWLQTLMCIACGTRLWISSPVKKRNSLQELASFLLVNLLLFLPWLARLLQQPERLVTSLLAYAFVLLAGIAFGGIGSLAAGGKWHIGFPRAGALLTFLLACLGVVFPMVGRWYPNAPTATKECRRALGVQAAVEWVGVMAVFALGTYILQDNAFLHQCASFAASLLVYRVIWFMPFGGARVLNWNKIAFFTLALSSIGLIAGLFLL